MNINKNLHVGDYSFISMNARWEGEKPDQRDIDTFVYLMKQKELTLTVVLKAHRILMEGRKTKEGFSACPGVMRTYQGMAVGNKVLLEPQEVRGCMSGLFTNVNEILNMDEDYGIILFHILFLTIHPFIDGNGRVARMLAYWMENKKEYVCEWLHQRSKSNYNLIFKKDSEFLAYARKSGIC